MLEELMIMTQLYLEKAIKNYASKDPSEAIKGFYQILNIEHTALMIAFIERNSMIEDGIANDSYLALLDLASNQIATVMSTIEKIASYKGIDINCFT